MLTQLEKLAGFYNGGLQKFLARAYAPPGLPKKAEMPGLLPFNLLGSLVMGAQGAGAAVGSTGKMLKDVGEGVQYLHEGATENIGKPIAAATGLDPIAAPALGLLALGVGGAGGAALARGLLGQVGKSTAKLGAGIVKAPFQALAYPFRSAARKRSSAAALENLRKALH